MVRALASHQCGPGSNPDGDAICELSLLLVLSLAPRGFSLGTSVFPSPQIPLRSGTHRHVSKSSYELLGAPWGKQITIFFVYYSKNPHYKILSFSKLG